VSGNSMTADLADLAQVPDMVRQVRAMFEGFQALAEVAEAASSTGSIAATAAIALLGVELGAFLVKTLEALDDDVDNLTDGRSMYEGNENQLQQSSNRIGGELGRVQYA
jgi:hypothetical protein